MRTRCILSCLAVAIAALGFWLLRLNVSCRNRTDPKNAILVNADIDVREVRWSGDGKYLFFTGAAQGKRKLLYRYHLETGTADIYALPEEPTLFDVSPDQRSVVITYYSRWARGCPVAVYDLDGRRITRSWFLSMDTIMWLTPNTIVGHAHSGCGDSGGQSKTNTRSVNVPTVYVFDTRKPALSSEAVRGFSSARIGAKLDCCSSDFQRVLNKSSQPGTALSLLKQLPPANTYDSVAAIEKKHGRTLRSFLFLRRDLAIYRSYGPCTTFDKRITILNMKTEQSLRLELPFSDLIASHLAFDLHFSPDMSRYFVVATVGFGAYEKPNELWLCKTPASITAALGKIGFDATKL